MSRPDELLTAFNRVPESPQPALLRHADLEGVSDDGVLVAAGDGVGGCTLFVKEGKPMYEYNYFTVERFKIVVKDRLTPSQTRSASS